MAVFVLILWMIILSVNTAACRSHHYVAPVFNSSTLQASSALTVDIFLAGTQPTAVRLFIPNWPLKYDVDLLEDNNFFVKESLPLSGAGLQAAVRYGIRIETLSQIAISVVQDSVSYTVTSVEDLDTEFLAAPRTYLSTILLVHVAAGAEQTNVNLQDLDSKNTSRVVLSPFSVYQARQISSQALARTLVTADKPVAVFGSLKTKRNGHSIFQWPSTASLGRIYGTTFHARPDLTEYGTIIFHRLVVVILRERTRIEVYSGAYEEDISDRSGTCTPFSDISDIDDIFCSCTLMSPGDWVTINRPSTERFLVKTSEPSLVYTYTTSFTSGISNSVDLTPLYPLSPMSSRVAFFVPPRPVTGGFDIRLTVMMLKNQTRYVIVNNLYPTTEVAEAHDLGVWRFVSFNISLGLQTIQSTCNSVENVFLAVHIQVFLLNIERYDSGPMVRLQTMKQSLKLHAANSNYVSGTQESPEGPQYLFGIISVSLLGVAVAVICVLLALYLRGEFGRQKTLTESRPTAAAETQTVESPTPRCSEYVNQEMQTVESPTPRSSESVNQETQTVESPTPGSSEYVNQEMPRNRNHRNDPLPVQHVPYMYESLLLPN